MLVTGIAPSHVPPVPVLNREESTDYIAVPPPSPVGPGPKLHPLDKDIQAKLTKLRELEELMEGRSEEHKNARLQNFPDEGVPLQLMLSGIDGVVNAANASQVYAEGSHKGFYSVAMSNEPDWNFQPIRQNVMNASQTVAPIHFAVPSPTSYCSFRGPMLGMGHFPTIWAKVQIPHGAVAQTFELRAFAEVEYRTTAGSLARSFSTPSARYDSAALCQYQLIAKNLPIAVPSEDNANFWSRVLKIVRTASGVLENLPGEFGEIARGVHLASQLL